MPRYEIYWTATGISEIDAADPTAAADELTDALFAADETQSVHLTQINALSSDGLIIASIDPESIWPVITPLTFTEEI